MTKAQLREIYRKKRVDLHAKDRLKMDDLMLLQLQQFDFSDVQTLFTYWPKADSAEPNTHLFNGYLRHFVPGLQMCYPVSDYETETMKAVGIDETTVYIGDQYGIMQPKSGFEIEPVNIDLVFVPLLVCDLRGYRVGYGKGFYDKFLASCRQDVVTFGFSYFEPVNEIEDIAEFDIPLDILITPNSIHEF